MHNPFERLLIQLDEEEAAYRALLKCTRNEKQAIVALDVDELTRIGRRKADMTVKLRSLAGQRERALRSLAEKMALPPDALTLRQLSREAPPPYDEKLLRRRGRLGDLTQQLVEETDSIRQLVNHGLALVRGSYQLITQLLDASPVYCPSGDMQPASATGRLHRSDY